MLTVTLPRTAGAEKPQNNRRPISLKRRGRGSAIAPAALISCKFPYQPLEIVPLYSIA
jgi:hypothetical protein